MLTARLASIRPPALHRRRPTHLTRGGVLPPQRIYSLAADKQRPKQRHLLHPSHRTRADPRRTQTLRRAIPVCRFGEQRWLPRGRRSAERISIQAQQRPKPLILRLQRLDRDQRRRKPSITHALISRPHQPRLRGLQLPPAGPHDQEETLPAPLARDARTTPLREHGP